MVESVKLGGEYYGLPTAVRALALFYNKDMFREAGLDPEARRHLGRVRRRRQGDDDPARPAVQRIGYGPGGQDHHLIRTVLMNQLGTPPYSADNTEVLYGGEIGAAGAGDLRTGSSSTRSASSSSSPAPAATATASSTKRTSA
jgi:multiple sugar transport system substrate-binding protein